MLKIQGLHKKYGNYHALDGLDMELKDGALFGFVGPNGAGKTTIIWRALKHENAPEVFWNR